MKLSHGKAQRTKGVISSPVGDVDQLDGNAEPMYEIGLDGAIKF
jgi:hypothetical protein